MNEEDCFTFSLQVFLNVLGVWRWCTTLLDSLQAAALAFM